MKLRTWLAGVMVAVFLLGMLPPATADEHRGLGDYDQHHEWHDADWWREKQPDWVRKHHSDWLANGDWDTHHHWHDRDWWKAHDPKWAHEHHSDWF